MYRIMKEGGDVAIVEKPIFIRLHDNGSFVQTERDSAQGIAIKGMPYNLLGAEPLDESFETVWPVEINGGEYIIEQQATIDGMILTLLEG